MATFIDERDAALAVIQSLIYPNGIGAINGQVHQDNETNQTNDAYANLWGYDNFSYRVVRNSGDDVANGTALSLAYADALTLTPGGNALSPTNRAAVIVPPGTYSLGAAGLDMTTNFVDLIGLGAPEDIVITSISNTNTGSGTIILNAGMGDVILANLTFQNTAVTNVTGTDTDDSAFAPQAVSPDHKVVNCIFRSDSLGSLAMRLAYEYAGVYTNCTVADGNGASIAFAIASGTFKNCTTSTLGFGYLGDATGTFTDCSCLTGFGYGDGLTVSGTFTNCKAQTNSFGFNIAGATTVTGKFYRCTADAASFGNSASGAYFEDCTVTVLGFGPPSFAATMAGTYVRCKGGVGSFGVISGSVLSGSFTDCEGGASSFGSGTTCTLSGTFTRCVGGDNSFGQQSSTLSGTFNYCIGGNACFGYGASSATISTLSGAFYYCKGGDDCFGRNSSITSAAIFDHCVGRDRCFGQGANTLLSSGVAGTFKHCIGRDACFGAGMTAGIKAAGTFEHCNARNGSFASGAGSEASGTFRYCVSGDTSFGYAAAYGVGEAPIASGTFEYCRGGDNCFGSGTGNVGGVLFSGYAKGCMAGTGSFGSNYSGSGTASVAATAVLYDCEAGYQSFSLQTNTFGLMAGTMVNCKLITAGVVGVTDTLSPVSGRMENCQITTTAVNSSAITVSTNKARLYGCTLIGNGTGYGVTAAGAVNAAIAHCRMPATGINVLVTNLIGTPYNVIDADITS